MTPRGHPVNTRSDRGTLNFIKGSPLCCVSLALLSHGQPVFGIVDLPLLGQRYIAREGGGAYLMVSGFTSQM